MIISVDKIQSSYITAKNCVENFDWGNLFNRLENASTKVEYLQHSSMPIDEAIKLLIVELARFFVLKAIKKDYDSDYLVPSFLVNWAWQHLTQFPEDYKTFCHNLMGSSSSAKLFTHKDVCNLDNFCNWKDAHEKYAATLKLYRTTFNEESPSKYWAATFGFIDQPTKKSVSEDYYSTENLRNLSINDLTGLLVQETTGLQSDAQASFQRGTQCLDSVILMLNDHYKRKMLKRKLEFMMVSGDSGKGKQQCGARRFVTFAQSTERGDGD